MVVGFMWVEWWIDRGAAVLRNGGKNPWRILYQRRVGRRMLANPRPAWFCKELRVCSEFA